MTESHTQHSQKVKQMGKGPFFFVENITGQRYLVVSSIELIPALTDNFPNENIRNLPIKII